MSTPTRSAVGLAGGIALAVTGGATALFLTVGAGADADSPTPEPVVVTEYVDQYGNPVAAPDDAVASSTGVNPPPIVIDVVDASTGETLEAATVDHGTLVPTPTATDDEQAHEEHGAYQEHEGYEGHDEHEDHHEDEEDDDD